MLCNFATKTINMVKEGYINKTDYGKVTVVENHNHQWAVIDEEGNFIVPFGKYGWIDGFEKGLARVRTNKDIGYIKGRTGIVLGINTDNPIAIIGEENIKKYYENARSLHPEDFAKWGIINENGEEVLPVIYDDVWKFFGKNRYTTKVVKDGKSFNVRLSDLNPVLSGRVNHLESSYDYDDYSSHYGEFAGTYAQDVMGYSDDVINDAFDGDPEAYWNID